MTNQNAKTARSYRRLTDEEFAQASKMWASGENQLVEIAETFGVSIRSLQMRFAEAGVAKGSTRDEALALIEAPVLSIALPSDDELPGTVAAMRARSYGAALAIEDAILRQVEVIKADPASAHKSNSTLKALFSASAALEKLHDLKVKALNLDQKQDDDLPALIVRELFSEDIERIRADQDDDGDDEETVAEDDIVLMDDLDA